MAPGTAVVAGIPMRWQEHGSGDPVVLLHGIPTSPALWRHVMPRLDGRVLAWEMVGYGSSIPAGEGRDISVSAQAGYLLAWMDELGIERPILVGHDLGGGVAQIAATRARDRIAGLVLTNSIAYDSWPIPSVKAMRALAPAVAAAPDPMVRAVLATLMYRGHERRPQAREALQLHLQPYLDHGGTGALVRQMRALDTGDTLAVAGELPHLELPARVVWGEADRFQKVVYGERLARDLGAPLRRIAGGKHFTPEDHPQEIADAVRSLLAAGTPPAR
ncbi:MAG TPA: alpha/beta fold hydrolase [Acidimicrobiales bacterium]|jgi:pimeloyl-ACP methyl ester carboxylesterase|nr:alpha/beta fold hydrolase [Acidimicrobiales bacterium]